jgi:cell division septation protein DedD
MASRALIQRSPASGGRAPAGRSPAGRSSFTPAQAHRASGLDFDFSRVRVRASDGAIAGYAGGAPLPRELRAMLEPLAGARLDRVRVHTDRRAAATAEALDANAVTVGQDIFFGEGRYRPGSEAGRRLIAHEVAHTVQQRAAAAPARQADVSEPGDPLELEADAFADASLAGKAHTLSSATTLSIACDRRGDRRGRKYLRDLVPMVVFGVPMVTDEAIEETEEFKSYMDHNLIWQWKHHATQDEAYEACRMILWDLWTGKRVDWDRTATQYLLAARRALQRQAPAAPTTPAPPTGPTPPTTDVTPTPEPPTPEPPTPEPREEEPKQRDKEWEIKDPGIRFPVLDPGGEDLYKRVQRILDDLVARGDEEAAREIKELWSGVTLLLGSAATLIGFYVISMKLTEAGTLLVILDEARIADQIFSRVWHRFENDVRGELEKKLGELDRKLDQHEPAPPEPEPQEPEPPKQPSETCATAHPDKLACDDKGISAYRWEGTDVQNARAIAYTDIKDAILTRDIRMNPTTPAKSRDVAATTGPCFDKGGTHTLVKDVSGGRDITFGSIVCCPCCRDADTGPIARGRCGFVGKPRWSRLFP